MARYVLKHRGSGPPETDLDLIEQSPGVTIVDRSVPRALLIDAPEEKVRELSRRLPAWTVEEEITYPPPGPAREEVRGPGEEPSDP